MSELNTADAIYLGAARADRAYLGATKVWQRELLPYWFSKLAAAATAPARALWVGDSAFEGTGSSNLRHRSFDLILDDLVASYAVAGYGRNEYLPAHYGWDTAVTPWGPDWYSSKSGTVTDYNGGIAGGSGNTTNTFGLGMRSSDMATSAILTYTVTGTDADIWTAAGGSYQVSIDGGAYGATVNTSAQNAYADNSQQVHLGSSGSHTIAIKCTAGTVHLLGFTIYDGGRDKGIVMYDSCHWGGMASSQYLSSDATLSAKFSRHVALVAPHLVIINVGINDSNVYSKADVAANLQAMYEALLAQAPDASYMVLQNYDEVPDSDIGGAGYTYGEAKQTVVDFATNNDLPICYLSPPMPMASTDTGGYYTSDDEHMSDKGQALAETVISAFIDPLYAGPPMELIGTLPNATVGALYHGELTLTGSFTTPVTIDASSGSLPSWATVTVSGDTVSFDGTPTTEETETFTPQATDSSSTPQVAEGPSQSIVVGDTPTGISIGAHSSGNGSTASMTTSATGSGMVVGVSTQYYGAGDGIVVTDSKSNAFTLLGTARESSGTTYYSLYYCANIAGGLGHIVTATRSGANPAVFAAEIVTGSGIAPDAGDDQQSTATPVSSPSVTTTADNEVVIGFAALQASGSRTITTSDGSTLLESTSAAQLGALSARIVSSAGSYTASFDVAGGAATAAVVISTFKAG